jgi:hypothetical protein
MIDPATGWFEMREIPNKEAITIANLVEQTWFTRYPWPSQVRLWHKKKANNNTKSASK